MSAATRLIFLIAGFHSGGAETQARYLVTGLARRGVEVHVFTFPGEPELEHLVQAAGVPITFLPLTRPKIWSLSALAHVRTKARQRRIRLVQSFLPTMDVVAPLIRFYLPEARVITSRRSLDEYLNPRDLRRLRVTGHLAHRIVGNSQAVAESVARLEGFRPPKVRVIPNGIPLPPEIRPEERAAARAAFGLGEDELAVAFVSHFRRGKGHGHLPGLAAELRRLVPSAVLLLAGDPTRAGGTIHAAVRSRLEEAGLLDRVRFLGDYRDQRTLFAAADASLNLSDSEGMSNSVLESMAFGVPVVATAVGGNREVIRDGRDGRLVLPSEVVPATAAALLDWAERPAVRLELGRAARMQIAAEYSIDRMIDRHLELYRELEASGAGRARAEVN